MLEFISEIEKNIGEIASKNYMPMQNGDVAETWADISVMKKMLAYSPKVSVSEGVRNFVDWYKEFYMVTKNRQSHLETAVYH
ncbi:hypothetical protein [Pedobacter steynii]